MVLIIFPITLDRTESWDGMYLQYLAHLSKLGALRIKLKLTDGFHGCVSHYGML